MTRLMFALGVLVFSAACGDDSPSPTAPPVASRPGRISLSIYPTSLLFSGSSVQVTARVTNDRGEVIAGTPISFTSESGTFEPATTQTSNIGMAAVTFTSDRPTTIVANAAGARGEQAIEAIVPYSLRMSASTDGVSNIADVTLSALPNILVVNPPAPTRLSIDCGDGTAHDVPPSGPPRAFRCTFSTAGEHTIYGQALAANGWSLRESVSARVGAPSAQQSLSIASVSPGAQGPSYIEVGFTATTAGVVFQHIGWDFGDGSSASSDRLNESHIYRAPGTYTVRVTGTPTTGANVTATRDVSIISCDGGRLCVSTP